LSFPTQTFNRLTSEVGLWTTTLFNSSLATFMLQLKVAWTNDFGNQALETQAALLDQPFSIATANPGRDAAVVDVNLTAWQTENVRVFARYWGRVPQQRDLKRGLRRRAHDLVTRSRLVGLEQNRVQCPSDKCDSRKKDETSLMATPMRPEPP
jgi:hypothetical protein